MGTLKQKYQQEIVPELAQLNGKNPMSLPKLDKIMVSAGTGQIKDDKNSLEILALNLSLITGQKPVTNRAKKAIANFRLREGEPIGLTVTLRGQKMYDFFEKLVKIVLPRIRDFQGVSRKSFDQQGNYSLGISEITVFPEVDFEKIGKSKGLGITFTFTAGNQKDNQKLLEAMGLPFEKDSQKGSQ